MTRRIAVIDIGKTNAKLVLVDGESLNETAVITRPNTVLTAGPWPHFDVEGHWTFLINGLRNFHAAYGIDAISVATHGACVALLDAGGKLAAPILDYEFSGPDDLARDYDAIRPLFAETGSPRLPGGLNIGAQLFWQFRTDPGLKARTHRIVTYPQYWGAGLTGVTAMDVTSLGCHSDLWNPHTGDFSSLIPSLGISEKLAPVCKPADVLGSVLPQIAKQTGLRPDTPVHCGIHDSNASLLPYVLCETPPFSVISTGTWVVAMSIGGKPKQLDSKPDTLINVTALGHPAPSARFMGGREYGVLTGGSHTEPTPRDLDRVLSDRIMLLPSFAAESGPFKGHKPGWIGPEPKTGTGQRNAAAELYLALVTAECLANIGHAGPIMVEGPFAGNRFYLEMLAAATDSVVYKTSGTTGTGAGAAMLAHGTGALSSRQTNPVSTPVSVSAENTAPLRHYASRWRQIIRAQSRETALRVQVDHLWIACRTLNL